MLMDNLEDCDTDCKDCSFNMDAKKAIKFSKIVLKWNLEQAYPRPFNRRHVAGIKSRVEQMKIDMLL